MLRRKRAKRRALRRAHIISVINATQQQEAATKETLLARFGAVRGKIMQLVDSLPPSEREEIFLGEWSAVDLVAHLIGWDYTYLGAVDELLAGEQPAFYALRDEDWATYNRYLVQQYFKPDWGELYRAVKQSQHKLLDCLQTIPEDEFDQDHGVHYDGSPVTIARLIKAEVKDEEEHYRQIREWVEEGSAACGRVSK